MTGRPQPRPGRVHHPNRKARPGAYERHHMDTIKANLSYVRGWLLSLAGEMSDLDLFYWSFAPMSARAALAADPPTLAGVQLTRTKLEGFAGILDSLDEAPAAWKWAFKKIPELLIEVEGQIQEIG